MVTQRIFGETQTGENVEIYHIENASGAYAEVLPFGAALVKLCVPDRDGNLRDVVLGYDDMAGYLKNNDYFGVTVGPNANRIENARFSVLGKEYILPQNEKGSNHHSGPNGFEKKLWHVKQAAGDQVIFELDKQDGENGFPGLFHVLVSYVLTDENELKITYNGICAHISEAAVANMTNHSYFNLAGEGNGDVFSHELKINAKMYTPVRDENSIPTGEYAPVAGTPLDFTSFKKIGADADSDFIQMKYANGFDHNYVTDYYKKGNYREVATAYCEESGIVMEVLTDCPCLQFYAGNYIDHVVGKNGHVYQPHSGFALESQFAPNAVNTPEFESPIIEAGEMYLSRTTYRFSVK